MMRQVDFRIGATRPCRNKLLAVSCAAFVCRVPRMVVVAGLEGAGKEEENVELLCERTKTTRGPSSMSIFIRT